MSSLLHKQVEATATPTIEKGSAVLLVAAYSKDRGQDVIQRGAFASTRQAWVDSGKQIPLAWNHDHGDPERLIGTVDPHSLKETRDGLIAEARLDLDGSETARSVWRLVKSDSIGVSFGYLAESEKGEDGTRLLTSIDLYEISLTATPMHGATRVVSWKSLDPEARRHDDAEEEFRALMEGRDRLDREREDERRRRRRETARQAKGLGLGPDVFERIAREGAKAKLKVEERKAEAEAKHRIEMAAKAARPITLATFSLE
jgi:HK97 family phage prohead protease